MRPRKPDPEWDHVYFSNYRMGLLSASAWQRQAKALLRAASLLETEVRDIWKHNMKWLKNQDNMNARATEIFAVHFMVVAFAIENLLKAALVRSEYAALRASFEKSGRLPAALKSHDLFGLAQRVGFAPTLEEEDVLRRLTRAAVWAGRYPVPSEFRDAASSEEFSDGNAWSTAHFFEDDPERLERFVSRLRNEIGM